MRVLCVILSAIGLSSCSSGSEKYTKLETVPYVDLNRYVGEWYEIARIDHWFQKGCINSRAIYSIRDDGDVDVINKCKMNSIDGKSKEAKGRAWVIDEESNAKLKVQFPLRWLKLPFLAGDYWIIALDENYHYVMIGEEKREYLWILSRTKTIPEETLAKLVNQAKSSGFPTDQLIYETY